MVNFDGMSHFHKIPYIFFSITHSLSHSSGDKVVVQKGVVLDIFSVDSTKDQAQGCIFNLLSIAFIIL